MTTKQQIMKKIEDLTQQFMESNDQKMYKREFIHDISVSIDSLLLDLKERVEEMIDENDDGMWAGRETADNILSLITSLINEQ